MPDRARAPLALRALAHRLARPEAPTFDLALMDGSEHRMGLGARPAFRIALRSLRGGRVLLSMDETRIDVSAFSYRYIFPGDHTPVVLPELFAAANRTAIEPIALHNDRHSYFLTLQAWARNLEAAHEELAARFGERVYRLFQIYLWAGAHLHRDGGLESYRVLFQKARDLPSADIGLSAAR